MIITLHYVRRMEEAVKNERKEIGPNEVTRKTPPRLFVKYPASLKSQLHLPILNKSDGCHFTAVEGKKVKEENTRN